MIPCAVAVLRCRRWERRFRDVLVHEYVTLDMELVVQTLNDVDPLDQFLRIVRDIEAS